MSVVNIFCLVFIIGAISTAHAETCAGCPKERKVDEPEIKSFLLKTVSLQNSKSNDESINVVKINKVSSQVVAGIKYTYDFLGEGQKSKKSYNCHSVILHQPWINPEPQVIEYKCSSKKSKRELVGGSKDVSPEELEQVKELVQNGMEVLDELDADDQKRVVLRIIEATKKLVNGIMYDVSVEVKMTSCPEQGLVTKECLNEEVSPQKICKLQIYRSFADKSPHNAKVVKSECDTAKVRSMTEIAELSASHTRRAADFATKMINGALNSMTVKGLVNVLESSHLPESGKHHTSLTLELGDTNCTKHQQKKDSECLILPNVENHMVCTVDVVLDEKTDKMHLQPGGFNCKDVKNDKTITNRARRALVGGERPLDLSNERIDDLKEVISTHFNQLPESLYKKGVVNIFSASYKMVSGRLVSLLVEIADTDCLVTEEDNDFCSFRKEGRLVCKINIWEKPGSDKEDQPISSGCSPVEPIAELLEVNESDENFQKFKGFTERFNRAYPTVQELKKRFRIFRANMKKIDYLQKTEQGSATYGPTMFADLSSSEFKKKYLGLKKISGSGPQFLQKQADIPDITLPEEYDWRHYNIVTPVKNQGMCGSCWAFSVTGNIEGQYAIKTGKLVSLSEQELVDCDKYDSGCEGGLFDTAYHAVEEMGGLEGESDYPYTGRDGTCRFDSSEVRVSISSSVNISHNETDMAKWLVANGPISIALNANAMQFYVGGVSHPLKFLCSKDSLDHGVLLVGYGVHKTWLLHRHLPYWLIKNSWGTHWGHSGYYMLYRGDGSCGVNQMPSSAVL